MNTDGHVRTASMDMHGRGHVWHVLHVYVLLPVC